MSPGAHKNILMMAIGVRLLLALPLVLAAADGLKAPGRQTLPKDSLQWRFTPAFQPGYDEHHQWMGGTETMHLVGHRGSLFAGMSYWADTQPGVDPKPGAQILRKDSAAGPWQVDVSFGPNYLRVEGMKSVALTTDFQGHRLDRPVSFLLASPFDFMNSAERQVVVSVRNDSSGQWTPSEIARHGGGVRSFGAHVDQTTRIHYLFAGTWGGRIFRGAFDPNAPARLRWETTPEPTDTTGRVMGFAECGGTLYAACGLKDNPPHTGGLFRRVDGPTPKWELVYQWPYLKMPQGGDESKIMRGLLAVPDPSDGHEVLVGTRAWPGVVERIDPRKNHEVSVELNIKPAFADIFGLDAYAGPALAAYNWLTPFTNPATGETVHLIGLWVNPPKRLQPPNNGAYYLVRRRDGSYEWGNIYDPAHPVPAGRQLRGARTICVSPFPEDRGCVLYFGGFDAYGGPHHNTAWIYKATLPQPGRL